MEDVSKYNPQWSNRFQAISSNVSPHLEDLVEGVLHLGGTSVKGMHSNPVINVDIVVNDFSNLDRICNKLEIAGYKFSGKDEENNRVLFKHNKSVPHELQLIQKDSLLYKTKTLLKKHLEENPTSFNEYKTLQQKYLQGKMSKKKYDEVKSKLITIYLKEEGMSEEDLCSI